MQQPFVRAGLLWMLLLLCCRAHGAEDEVGIKLAAKSDRNTYVIGDPIFLDIATTAERDSDLLAFDSNVLLDYDIVVTMPDHHVAPHTVYGKWLAAGNGFFGLMTFHVMKGSTDLQSLHLNRVFDMSLNGTYSVAVKREFSRRGEKTVAVTIAAPLIRIEVTGPATRPSTAPSRSGGHGARKRDGAGSVHRWVAGHRAFFGPAADSQGTEEHRQIQLFLAGEADVDRQGDRVVADVWRVVAGRAGAAVDTPAWGELGFGQLPPRPRWAWCGGPRDCR